jgi:glutamine synthetase
MLQVICDAYTPQGVPIPTNKRAAAAEIFSKKEVAHEEETWFGLEQEYTLLQKDVKWPLGWRLGGYPGPQVKQLHIPKGNSKCNYYKQQNTNIFYIIKVSKFMQPDKLTHPKILMKILV